MAMAAFLLLMLADQVATLPTRAEIEHAMQRPRLHGCDDLTCVYDTRRFVVRNATCTARGPDVAICEYERMSESPPTVVAAQDLKSPLPLLKAGPPRVGWWKARDRFKRLHTSTGAFWSWSASLP